MMKEKVTNYYLYRKNYQNKYDCFKS